MSTVQEQAQKLADNLIGTCEGTPEEVFDVDGLAEALDALIGECDGCGWWYWIDDLNADRMCEDCAESVSL